MDVLTRGVANIIPDKHGLEKALSSQKLNIYLGIDPTSTHIHLGHAVALRKLAQFAELGHNVTFLIGDFTALIGDTSDKDTERPVLTQEQIQENFKTYKSQAEKILDFSKVTIRNNSEWLGMLTFSDIIQLCQHFSFGDFASRELIKKRLTDGKRVGLHEALYPVMQGYDSYYMDTDLQVGGTDQTFNMQAGRALQKDLRQKESYVLTTEFLLGTDGRKMSKSWGNAIWLDDPASEMYGKVMSLSDELIESYFILGTNVPAEKLAEIKERLQSNDNPMHMKKELAYTIVAELHSQNDAEKAQNEFEQVFQKRDVSVALQPLKLTTTAHSGALTITDLVIESQYTQSKSDAKRIIEQGGVEYNGDKITNPTQEILPKKGNVLKIGKRAFYELQ